MSRKPGLISTAEGRERSGFFLTSAGERKFFILFLICSAGEQL